MGGVMSSVTISGDTSGSIILQAPSVAGSTTLTLPTTTGTLVTSNAMPTGSVLQVVNATTSTLVTNATNVYADTTLTASITPSKSSSKILVLISQNGVGKLTNNTAVTMRLVRNSTSIVVISDIGAYTGTTTENRGQSVSLCYLDSPATTSSTTYKTQFFSYNNNAAAYVQDFGSGSCTSTIILMEIAA